MTTTAGAVLDPWSGSAEGTIVGRTPFQLFWEKLREDKVALVALGFIVAEILIAVFAPWIVRAFGHPPNAQYPEALDPTYGTPTGPSREFLFGVDTVGRDVFSRVLYGARVSLEVAIVATAFAVVIGVVLGMVAGYFRGWVDTLISRLIDVTLAFPILLLALGIASSCSLGDGCAGGLIKPGLGTVIVPPRAAFDALVDELPAASATPAATAAMPSAGTTSARRRWPSDRMTDITPPL